MMRGLFGNNETDDKWLEIADRIKIEYDAKLDYHPQFDGYERGTEVKQADTILVGYPLMFSMNDSTRRNDLNFYANVTRKSGPAMTNSMFAINYLDIGDFIDANEMLEKSYKPYIRPPFNVWNEATHGVAESAGNFITGAGGFLQTIFNGFFGIRIHLNYLEIKSPQLPSNTTAMKIRGIKYRKSSMEIKVAKGKIGLRFVELKDGLILVFDDESKVNIQENYKCKFFLLTII